MDFFERSRIAVASELARRKKSQEWGRRRPIADRDLLRMKRSIPFHGLATVSIHGVPDFEMFVANDDAVAMRYVWFGPDSWEPTSLAIWGEICKRAGGAVIDVGAFTGLYSLAAVKSNPRLKVWAFEPSRLASARLLLNIQYNGMSRSITMVPQAIGAKVGMGAMTWSRAPESLSTAGTLANLKGELLHSEVVVVRDLDSFAASECSEKIAAIKMDVERYELVALAGMRRLLADQRPALLMEVAPADANAVYGSMADCGYTWALIDEDDGTITERAQPTGSVDNVIFCHTRDAVDLFYTINNVLVRFRNSRPTVSASSTA